MNEEILAQNQKREQLQKDEQQAQREGHLRSLQSWGDAQGEELLRQKQAFTEDVFEYQAVYDEAIIREMAERTQRVEVTASAHVTQPPAQQPAARESYKARREREKKRRAALKACPVGDENTLEISSRIRAAIDCRDLTQNEEMTRLAIEGRCDMRAMKIFCRDFALNKKGEPASEQDRLILEENRRYMREYATGSPLLRRPHLDRIKNEMISLNFALRPDMFTGENLVRRAAEYKIIADKFTYFENVEKENPEYFASLPPLERDLLSAQTAAAVAFTNAFVQHMNARGISINYGEIYGYDNPAPIEFGLSVRSVATESYTGSLASLREGMQNAFRAEVERRLAADTELEEAYAAQNELFINEYGVSFPSGGSELLYSDMAKYRNMIAQHPEEYESNRDLIDKVFADFYKTQSGRSELFLRQRKLSNVIADNNDPFGSDPIMKGLFSQADRMFGETVKSTALLEHYAQSLMELMEHLLRGKPLSDAASAVLRRYSGQPAEE